MLLHVIQSQVNPYEKGHPLKHPPDQHTQAQAPPAYIISHSRVFLMNEYNLRWDIGSKMRGSSYLYMLHDCPARLFSLCIVHILTGQSFNAQPSFLGLSWKSQQVHQNVPRAQPIHIAHHGSCHFRGAYLPLRPAGVSKPASCASRCSARRFFRLLQYLPCLGLVGSHKSGRSIQELVANSRQKTKNIWCSDPSKSFWSRAWWEILLKPLPWNKPHLQYLKKCFKSFYNCRS